MKQLSDKVDFGNLMKNAFDYKYHRFIWTISSTMCKICNHRWNSDPSQYIGNKRTTKPTDRRQLPILQEGQVSLLSWWRYDVINIISSGTIQIYHLAKV